MPPPNKSRARSLQASKVAIANRLDTKNSNNGIVYEIIDEGDEDKTENDKSENDENENSIVDLDSIDEEEMGKFLL